MIGDTVDSDFTFEELGAIIRKEKASGALTEVRQDLYPAMLRLLDKQSKECERQIGIDIGSLASAAANERRKRIHQNIKLVVELRMSKVAALAIRTAMGCVNATDNLPLEERQYYSSVLEASRAHWTNTERKKKNVVLLDIALFLWFLQNNGILYRLDGTKRIADGTLVALTLMIAESRMDEMDILVKVVVNLINRKSESAK